MSRAAVAAHIDIDTTTLWRYENGRVPLNEDRMRQFAQLYHVTIPWLMRWEDAGVPTEEKAA